MRQRVHLLAPLVPTAVISVGLATFSPSALAYRPFDGTDAAVADVGEVEIELQPAGFVREGPQTSLIAPAARFNYGFAKQWEVVVEGFLETPLSPSGPTILAEPAAFLKGVLREGSLQDKSGVSIATEFGVLLPESSGNSGAGASIAAIASQRWDWGMISLNAAMAVTREHHGDLFLSTIIEGPSKWTVRPVAEVFYENDFGKLQTVSGLVGAIWQVRDNLSFDVGLRRAVTNGHSVNEIRAGLTFGFSVRPMAVANRK
jgi:hypothetical protein